MSEKRRQSKAIKEIEESKILVDFILAHNLSFEDENNFTDQTVSKAKKWWKELNEEFDPRDG